MAENIYSDFVAVPANCEYIDMPGNYLPFTDTYVPEVADLEGCRAECNNQQGYNCRWVSGDISTIYYLLSTYLLIYRSFNYNPARRECFLSSGEIILAVYGDVEM